MTNLKDIWKAAFPTRTSGVQEAFLEHSKKVLDNEPDPVYTGVTNKEVIKQKEPEVAKVTVEDIVNATGNAYPAYVNELAKILRDTKIAYSLHASEYAAKLFAAQDSLGLSTDEMTKAIAAIISQKDIINSSVQSAIDIINKTTKVT